MGLKVFYKSPVMWNMVLFSIFSVAFIYFQNIYRFNSSILDEVFYTRFLKDNWPIVLIAVLTISTLLSDFKRTANILFMLLVSITLSITTYFLFIEFSKLSLVLLFFYLLFSFYLFQFYSVESDESYYNPLYDHRDLFSPATNLVNIEVLDSDKIVTKGILTNWSEEGCFIHLDETRKLKSQVTLRVSFKNYSFEEVGRIVSMAKDHKGYGVKFKNIYAAKSNTQYGWLKFYEIIDEMGYKPELIR